MHPTASILQSALEVRTIPLLPIMRWRHLCSTWKLVALAIDADFRPRGYSPTSRLHGDQKMSFGQCAPPYLPSSSSLNYVENLLRKLLLIYITTYTTYNNCLYYLTTYLPWLRRNGILARSLISLFKLSKVRRSWIFLM